MLTHIPAYAALLGLFYIVLTGRVVFYRNKMQVALGDNEEKQLKRAIRAHGNFNEYVPLGLLLLLVAELVTGYIIALHASAICLIIGRALHALAISRLREPIPLRILGMVLTSTSIGSSAVLILIAVI